jgi:hypothetical protein
VDVHDTSGGKARKSWPEQKWQKWSSDMGPMFYL